MHHFTVSCTPAGNQTTNWAIFYPHFIYIIKKKHTFFVWQFPITLAFAIIINKAQGQTLEKAAIYLSTDVFGHGQLYVALSRPTSPAGLKVYTQNGSINNKQGVYTKNVVYRSAL